MNKVWFIKVIDYYGYNDFRSYVLDKGFTNFENAKKYLNEVVEEQKQYYIDNGRDEEDMEDIIEYIGDNEVKFDFLDEYTKYVIDTIEVE